MKIGDYFRLGRISIKSRKKSTRNTVTGICFGLIMLLPIIFFTLSFYLGLTGEINKVQTVSVFQLMSRNTYDEQGTTGSAADKNVFSMYDYAAVDKLTQTDAVQEKVVAEFYDVIGLDSISLNSSKYSLQLGETQYAIDPSYFQANQWGQNQNPSVNSLKVIRLNESGGRTYLESERQDLGGSIFTCGDGFSQESNGKTEVILSEYLLQAVGYSGDASALIGQKATMSVELYYALNGYRIEDGSGSGESNGARKFQFMTDFTVAGIVSKAYYALPSNEKEAHIWVTDASVYLDEGDALAPVVSFSADPDSQNFYDIKYSAGIQQTMQRAADSGRMPIALGALTFAAFQNNYNHLYGLDLNSQTEENYYTVPLLLHKLQYKDYGAAAKMEKTVTNFLFALVPRMESWGSITGFFSNDIFSNLSMINTIGGYLMLVLYSFGGIIFFATMLNLYNSVNYSVESRRNYIGVMRAIGAKKSMIPRLYFFEIVLIFLYALPWIVIIGGGISYLIKWGIDMLFGYIGAGLGLVISLNFAYFFITLGIVLLLVFLIALLFSRVSCYHVSNRAILDVLSDDKG